MRFVEKFMTVNCGHFLSWLLWRLLWKVLLLHNLKKITFPEEALLLKDIKV